MAKLPVVLTFSALLLILCFHPGECAAGHDPLTLEWEPNQETGSPLPSASPMQAALPLDLKIIPPASGVPAGLAAYSGIWSGGVCADLICDMKIAIQIMDGQRAAVTFAFASTISRPSLDRGYAQYRDGDLFFDVSPYYHVRLGLRKDGVMKFKRLYRDGNNANGALHSGWGLLAKVGETTAPGISGNSLPDYARAATDQMGDPRSLDWESGLDTMTPGTSSSSKKAKLPADVKIVPPGPDVPAGMAAYSGIWAGGICNHNACDVKLAVEKIDGTGAMVAFAFASDFGTPMSIRTSARRENGDLFFEPGPYYRIRIGLRKDGVMMIKRIYRDGLKASGALRKGSGVLAKVTSGSTTATTLK